MKSDIEIARECRLKPIEDIARQVQVPVDELEHYGKYVAKVPESLIDEKKVENSNLILVTAITPTKAGIGKTTVSVGLALGLSYIGKKNIVALREPSLGPCFGLKGGAEVVTPKYCRWTKSTCISPGISMPLLRPII